MDLKKFSLTKTTDFTIGILGGGQLAKMTAVEARKLGLNVVCLDPHEEAPASMVSHQIVGSVNDREKLHKLNSLSDVITYEIEYINTDILKEALVEDKVYPSIQVLEILQNKYKQRKFFQKFGIPMPFFKEIEEINQLKECIPCVQKAKVGGYDGRGVVVLKTQGDLSKAIKEPSYVEELVDIEKELAVIVVRNAKGDMKVYPVVEMVFNPDGNLLDYLIAPADVDEFTEKEAQNIAVAAVESLDGVGVFGVELFLDKKGRVLLNEVAPRTHNSGHYTIEACETSQFEQLVRVLTNLPLGSTYQYLPAATLNLLGEPGYKGKPIYENLDKVLSIDGVYVHIYGKKETFPLRKMGHITIIDTNRERLLEKVVKVKNSIKVKGEIKI
ncbi:5-(carboxyamino)imidazole ribonucleotide synthase [Sulfurihydrogenibium sp.]|uniref:5-(carboxyamino)imidazole ribonucleotide synthase n=1 Tax=Sulfurihydrogenibium sp. TaxID=2053621 RepID=UPI002633AD84|nr:5-(carboxyamino)imidazole ribonucleotide synthase [Sulfurihydrogenibium sp.]